MGNDVPVWLNRRWVEADVRITTGFVEPHFFAGFSGGPKMVAPGLAGLETTLTLHDAARIGHPSARWGITEGNPVHDDVRAIAAATGTDFSLDVILDGEQQIVQAFGGELFAMHRAACAVAKEVAMRAVPVPFDVVVTSNSGYPLDQNLYQAVKGMSAAAQVVKAGGLIVCAAECRDGFPDHGSYRSELAAAASPQALLDSIRGRTETVPDQWQIQIQADIQTHARVVVHTSYLSDEDLGRPIWSRPRTSPRPSTRPWLRRVRTHASACSPRAHRPSPTSASSLARIRILGRHRALEVLAVATRLGLTSFGGPVAHLGYFREEYVERRRWLSDRSYADLVALCQFLPGPASSQVGIGIGRIRAGYLGSILAWVGFTLPSVALLVLFAWLAEGITNENWLEGLKIVAVSVVSFAVWSMARTLTPDRERIAIALGAAILVLAWTTPGAQVLAIALGGLLGWRLLTGDPTAADENPFPSGTRIALVSLGVFVGLLVLLPILARTTSSGTVEMLNGFYRAGSLVFGGGHVVLPLLESSFVGPGWVSSSDFVAGYGATQAVPGPLFTFAAYLGYVMTIGPGGVAGAALATITIFLPSFLLIFGTLPFWGFMRHKAGFKSALLGINAAVVGLLLAALYDPVWTSAIHDPTDFALALAGLGLLAVWRLPPWLVVVVIGLAGALAAQWL